MKVVIFTEGQSELIFTRVLLYRFIFGFTNVSIRCLRLQGSATHNVPYDINNASADYYFQIVNVGTDNKVISYIIETFENLSAKGFDLIIGLRDIFSEEYKQLSDSVDETLIQKFKNRQKQTLSEGTASSKQVKMFFAVMEFEAWLLSMPHLFEKINPILTVDHIEQNLDVKLERVNPQRDIYHPTNLLKEIYELIDVKYKKSGSQIETIMAAMTENDLSDALEEGKCPSFLEYYSELIALL